MKNFFRHSCVLSSLILLLFIENSTAQSVAINNDGSQPNASAMLDVKSTTKGMLIPRMSTVQRTAIATLVKGLLVFDNDTGSFWYYNGSTWTELNNSSASANYWSADGNGNIYNNNAAKVMLGSGYNGPAFFNIKSQVSTQMGLFMSETGTTAADYLFSGIYQGGGTSSTRFGTITGNFGNGFNLGNQSNAPLTFQTYTSEKMRIAANGYVGIGTLNPTSQLEVQSLSSVYGLTHTDGTVRLSTMVNNLGGSIGTTTNNHLKFFVNGTDQMTISTTGNVGIGGQIAVDKFEVYTPSGGYGMLQKTSSISVGTSIGSGAGWIGTATNNPLYFFTNGGGGSIALLQSGNVGIGTTGPVAKLHLYGNSNIGYPQLLLEESENDYARLTFKTTSTVNSGNNYWTIAGLNSNVRANERLNFYNAAVGDMMVITGEGNVGIGTTVPGYKLSVNGVIQAKEVRVETGWADFVFEKNYKLKPLNELKQFIDANKHLPEIPAADDIQKNGLPVGELQTKMMQKIEELTLYILNLQKQIDDLRSDKNENK